MSSSTAALVVSVLYRGCAIPVAWHILPANTKGAWKPHLPRLLRLLWRAVPRGMPVVLLVDCGLWSPLLWRRIRRLGWHPLCRVQATTTWTPAGGTSRPARALVSGPGHAYVGWGRAMRAQGWRPWCTLLVGLTAQGRAWLEREGAETDPAVLERAIVRDWRRPELKTGQLAHDLLVVEWCSRALIGLRGAPLPKSVEIVMEYVSATAPSGQPLQRFDALMRVQFAPGQQDAQNAGLPWGSASPDGGHCLAWAIEIDRGTEPLVTLLGKAVMYRDLTVSGHYAAMLGCTPLPVVVTPTGRRAAQIAREWVDGWPGGRGIVAPVHQLADDLGGVLWGRYKTLGLNPARDATLWDDVGLTREPWAR